MAGDVNPSGSYRIRSLSIAIMLVLTTITLTAFTSSAVGTTQNDMNSGGDLLIMPHQSQIHQRSIFLEMLLILLAIITANWT